MSDGHRVRRITRSDNGISRIQGIQSFNRVVTVAGAPTQGNADGNQTQALFSGPQVCAACGRAGPCVLVDAVCSCVCMWQGWPVCAC